MTTETRTDRTGAAGTADPPGQAPGGPDPDGAADAFDSHATVAATVNGVQVTRRIPVRLTLVEFLRDELNLTGTKVSCALEVCGACTVLVDGRPVSACACLATDIDGHAVQTVEGLANADGLHPLQRSFVECFALQCGFCTPGFLMMGKALLDRNPAPSRAEIVEHIDGNLCRCTGYEPIVTAIDRAAKQLAGEDPGPVHG
jgi:aerobic-type carbon monoxide dehydrogenase small subunit (CoxS/CutS family)